MNAPLRIMQSPQVAPDESKNTLTSSTQERLDALKKEIEATQDAERKKELIRLVARLERFDAIQSGTAVSDEKIRREVTEILTGKNTDTYLASDLLSLRKRGIDITALTLVDKAKNIATGAADLTAGKVLTVNFGDNPHLARRIGAGDILPLTVRKVNINGVEAMRGNTPRPGYYDRNGKYQPIYDGDTITILEMGNASPEDETAMEARWKNERVMDTALNNDYKRLTSLPDDNNMEELAQSFTSATPKAAAITFPSNFTFSAVPEIDLRKLKHLYPNEASIKNNNPAGITWNSGFDNPKPGNTAYMLKQAGISFFKGTARPAREGWHYVWFHNARDGVNAQKLIMLGTYGDHTVDALLQKWVWTSQWPQYAKQVAGMANITDLKIKVSELSDAQLWALQGAKMKLESPWFYKEVMTRIA